MDPSTIEISSVTFPSLLTRSWSMRDRPGTLKPPGSSATKAMMMIIRLMCIIIMLIMVLLQPWQCNDDGYYADMHHHRLDVWSASVEVNKNRKGFAKHFVFWEKIGILFLPTVPPGEIKHFKHFIFVRTFFHGNFHRILDVSPLTWSVFITFMNRLWVQLVPPKRA